MVDFIKILSQILLTESVDVNNVNDAISKHYRVMINYKTKGENIANGPRMIEVYAYGLSKAGNQVIRAFQPYGDTSSRVPSWKLFRLDRIISWKPTNQFFTRPASDYYKGIGEFNKDGDLSMSTVYNIANFDHSNVYKGTTPNPKPKDNNEVYKTDTERNMERLRQQLNSPVYIKDMLPKNKPKDTNVSGPKEKPENILTKGNEDPNLYKTDYERKLNSLADQLKNPKYVDKSVLDQYNKEKDKRNKKWDTQRSKI